MIVFTPEYMVQAYQTVVLLHKVHSNQVFYHFAFVLEAGKGINIVVVTYCNRVDVGRESAIVVEDRSQVPVFSIRNVKSDQM